MKGFELFANKICSSVETSNNFLADKLDTNYKNLTNVLSFNLKPVNPTKNKESKNEEEEKDIESNTEILSENDDRNKIIKKTKSFVVKKKRTLFVLNIEIFIKIHNNLDQEKIRKTKQSEKQKKK